MYRPALLDERLDAVLPPGSLYAVGGRVRDEIRAEAERIEAPAGDADYVVAGVPLEELVLRLRPAGAG